MTQRRIQLKEEGVELSAQQLNSLFSGNVSELVRVSGISRDTVVKLLKGEGTAQRAKICRFAEALQIKPDLIAEIELPEGEINAGKYKKIAKAALRLLREDGGIEKITIERLALMCELSVDEVSLILTGDLISLLKNIANDALAELDETIGLFSEDLGTDNTTLKRILSQQLKVAHEQIGQQAYLLPLIFYLIEKKPGYAYVFKTGLYNKSEDESYLGSIYRVDQRKKDLYQAISVRFGIPENETSKITTILFHMLGALAVYSISGNLPYNDSNIDLDFLAKLIADGLAPINKERVVEMGSGLLPEEKFEATLDMAKSLTAEQREQLIQTLSEGID